MTRGILSTLVVLALAVWAMLRGVALPVRDLPQPTGPHPVATVAMDLTDPSRAERYRRGPDEPEYRTFRVQLWFPGGEAGEERAGSRLPWVLDGPRQTREIVRTHGFPPVIWAHTRRMRAWSERGPEFDQLSSRLKPDTPLALIIHGWEGYRALHADLAEELASRGWLVAAADHSYGAAATVLGDGRVLRSGPDVLPERGDADFHARATRLVSTFAADAGFMLDQLTALVPRAEVTVIGHSTGGGAAVRLALSDTRIDRLVGLDAWVEPLGTRELTRARLQAPALFLRSEEWEAGINDSFLLPFLDTLSPPASRLYQIDGITHEQFSALYMYAPAARWVGFLGPVDAREAGLLLRDLVADFADSPLHRPAWPVELRLSEELAIQAVSR